MRWTVKRPRSPAVRRATVRRPWPGVVASAVLMVVLGTAAVGTGSGLTGPAVRALGPMREPIQIFRHDHLVYVAGGFFDTPRVIHVVDTTRRGAESIVERIETPVRPVEMALAGGRLVIANDRGRNLYTRPLAGGDWLQIPLPDYGGLFSPLRARGRKVFIARDRPPAIDVVDLDDGSVRTLDGFVQSPGVVLRGPYLIATAYGVGSSLCDGTGPSYAVYRLSDMQKISCRDLGGRWIRGMTVLGRRVYVVTYGDDSDDRVASYDLHTGKEIAALDVPGLTDVAPQPGRGLVGQDAEGNVFLIDARLRGITAGPVPLLTRRQVWYPPLAGMIGVADDRTFVVNLNDGSLSIVDWRVVDAESGTTGVGSIRQEPAR